MTAAQSWLGISYRFRTTHKTRNSATTGNFSGSRKVKANCPTCQGCPQPGFSRLLARLSFARRAFLRRDFVADANGAAFEDTGSQPAAFQQSALDMRKRLLL